MKNQTQTNLLRNKYPEALEGNVLQAKYFYFDMVPGTQYELAIVFGGHERCASDFEINRTTYPYYVIECPVKGKCTLRIDNEEHLLQKGTISLLTKLYEALWPFATVG